LLVATVFVYQPAWHGRPLWDDGAHIAAATLDAPGGLKRIWLELGAVQQYYPLTHSVFWLERRLWGSETFGYHIVSILLHALSALMALKILRLLGIKGAFLAAAVFALHPVQVESVAWMAELKNTLSTVFYLGALLAYLRFDERRTRSRYVLALILFILGLMAKTVVATWPVGVLAIVWWRRGEISLRRDVAALGPFFLVGLGAGLLTAWVEWHFIIGSLSAHYTLGLIERCLLAGRVFWFYLGKLVWPAELIFIYPRWEIDASTLWQYLFPLAALGLLGAAWLLRRRTRGPLAALAFFLAGIFPALGFVDVFPFRYSYVADHFQYLASLGVIALLSAVATTLAERWLAPRRMLIQVLGLALAVLLATLTWRQSRIYADSETLYTKTLEGNPRCFLALNNLGMLRAEEGRLDEAERFFARALEVNPQSEEAHNNLGHLLARRGKIPEAIQHFNESLGTWDANPQAHNNLANALVLSGKPEEAVLHYRRALAERPDFVEAHNNLGFALLTLGRMQEGIRALEEALAFDPTLKTALVGLAQVLATTKDARLRDGRRAVRLAERARSLVGSDDPALLNVLAAAYAEAGRFDEAIATATRALELVRAAKDRGFEEELVERLSLYRQRQPARMDE